VARDGAGYVLVLGAAALWSTSGLFIRWTAAGGGLSALSLAFWRDLATFACLLTGLVLFARSQLRVERRDLPWLAALGALSIAVFHTLWNLAILNLGYAVATVLLYSMPAFVTLMAWLLWREPLTRTKVLAILLTYAGCVLVTGPEELAGATWTAGGLLLGLTAAMAYGSFGLLGRHVTGRYSPWTILTYGFGFGALALLPLQLLLRPAAAAPTQPAPIPVWASFASLVLVATILPFGTYLAALRRLPVSVASILAASEVAFGALVGYLFFGETLGTLHILGALLVVAGVALIALRGNGG
jgi:drug/metabolite transporter (DMT)-like permease